MQKCAFLFKKSGTVVCVCVFKVWKTFEGQMGKVRYGLDIRWH